ncbi:4-hydroxy-tetrahydrodipicolinate synthase [Polymorphobacter multimanifer]|uniref:4-hydroxy-tetrahydrodipicolinate synthase n=1 Tax=Polymorphobacter multimanifer TaxID=1070431 RepID=A0A841L0C0_9SPHN|nr:4-hydroxy-tetrahydrodipicolinate synthase [Polymorphobacter multimanifer]MBB6225984.1 4-hydroxy-tetrahydrodipicolinate synthase [Polymorphobacter multimanifer]
MTLDLSRLRGSLRGSMPALVTPFRDGAVDTEALDKFIEWQIAEGSRALVPVGTTGESPTLSHAEHYAVITRTVQVAAGRVPVIAGCGSNDTATARAHLAHAEAAGADAALLVVPYYNKPSQAGLVAHFTALANATTLPIILYNIPGRSVADLGTAAMAELAKLPNIVGVKDATGNLGRVSAQRAACGADFIQLSGNDDMALGFNALGGVGAISVTANVAPRLCADMQAAMLAGDYAKALAINDRLWPLHDALFSDASPGPTKYALARLGHMTGDVRLPILPPSQASRAAVDAALAHAGLV